MGYSHGKKWKKGEVKKEIKKVMKSLNLKRMPTNKECIKVTKNYGLSNKISKTGGFYKWAKKIDLEIKKSATQKASNIENKVKNIINKKTDLKTILTNHKAPYDILVDDKVKIEVKYSLGYKGTSGVYYTANLYKGVQKADILVFICRNKELGHKDLIIPSNKLQGITQLSIGKNSKYDIYKNRWDYIIKYNEFIKKVV